jgi:hypothetical protein
LNTLPPDPATAATQPSDPLEDLLAAALASLETGGAAALQTLLDQHPQHAAAVREALGDLHRIDLLQPAAPEAPPQRFGEFAIKATLGSGGMGVVYLAEQTSLGREVALKVVRPELLLFAGARERFRREIDAVARLEHPAIVPILATGSAEGVPWYTMPRLRGKNAEAVVRELSARDPAALHGVDLQRVLRCDGAGPAATDASGTFAGSWWQAVVRLLRQAALGIQHAHERGVLHRDLKPSNLMLTEDGRAIVLDFGLAQGHGDARLTRTGSAAGSPAYMAPEQVRGEGADERTDVYGLGATLHCMLGLAAPFELGDGEGLRQRILGGQRDPLRGRHHAPRELELVVATAMDVDRGRRYPSAAAFADDLHAVLEGRTIAARRLPVAVRAARFAGRHRTLVAAAAVALLAAGLVPLLLWRQQRTANAELAREVERTERVNQELSRQIERADLGVATSLDAVEAFLGNLAMSKVRNQPAMQAVAADMLADALALFDRLADDPTHGVRAQQLRRRTLLDAAQLATTLARNDHAVQHATRLLQLLGEGPQTAGNRVQRATARSLLAWVAFRRDELAAIPPLLAAARDDLTGIDDAALATAVAHERANVLELDAALAERRGDRRAAEALLRERVALLGASPGASRVDRELVQARLALAGCCRENGKPAEAEQLLGEVETQLRAGGLPTTGWPTPALLLAMTKHEQASLAHGRKDLLRTIELGHQSLALSDELARDYPADPMVRRLRGRSANLVAVALHGERRWAEARPLLEQAIRDQQLVLQSGHGDGPTERYLLQHRRSLAVCLRELEDWPALAEVARTIGRSEGAENSGRAARDLLRCAAASTDSAVAAELCEEGLTLLEQAAAAGLRITANDPTYDMVRSHPRFVELLQRGR